MQTVVADRRLLAFHPLLEPVRVPDEARLVVLVPEQVDRLAARVLLLAAEAADEHAAAFLELDDLAPVLGDDEALRARLSASDQVIAHDARSQPTAVSDGENSANGKSTCSATCTGFGSL